MATTAERRNGVVELRDPELAKAYLLQGIWLQRALPMQASLLRDSLEWCREIAASGRPLPPPGFVADLGCILLTVDRNTGDARPRPIPGWQESNCRSYEDLVLGRIQGDWNLVRAGEAIRRFRGRDRARGLAFVIERMQAVMQLPGVLLSPSVLARLIALPPEQTLREGWELLERAGVMELLADQYDELVLAVRRAAELLERDDLPELETGLALDAAGPRLARHQVRQAAKLLAADLPARPRPSVRRDDTPTRLRDEDLYPVGGYNSLANRGPIESLLHSQLAYMEPDDRPDLFDVKFLRDELLYYSRDENEFRRRRRGIVLVLAPDLVAARFKNRDLPYQRGVLLLALLTSLIGVLSDWLMTEALRFELVFLAGDDSRSPLEEEKALLESLLTDRIASRALRSRVLRAAELDALAVELSEWGDCHGVAIGVNPPPLESPNMNSCQLAIAGSRPALLGVESGIPPEVATVPPIEQWRRVLGELLDWLR